MLTQTLTTYDSDGNPILVVTKDRFDNDASTSVGDLGSPTSGIGARDSYTAEYYDYADRLTDTVDVGTNGGSAWTRPSSVPSRSDTILVTHTDYDSAGRAFQITDPRGIVSYSTFDLLGRTTQVIAAYDGGSPTSSTNQTTNFTYDGDNHTLTMTAVMPSGTNDQITAYVYGVGGTAGTNLFSNDLIAKIEYPNKSTGSASTAAADDQSFSYDSLGEGIGLTDQNGTVHAYTYDVLGRLTDDTITTLGSGVDGSVQHLAYSFDTVGRPFKQTSYDGSASIVNQVEDVYNGLGQFVSQYQSHSGAVNTSTTPVVTYAYTQMSGGANDSRLTAMTYPNGRELDYTYNSGIDTTISRVSALGDHSTSTILEGYSYLGLGTIVQRSHPETGIKLTYIQQTGDTLASTDGGDEYTGLDRFGRVIDQNSVNGSGTSADRFQYGYDRGGDVLYKNNLLSSSNSELYHANGVAENSSYDNLYRLTNFARGTLSASGTNGTTLDTIAAASHSQDWSLDAQGSATSITTDGTAETRTVNSRDQLTGVGTSTLAFDNNGNTTTDERGYSFVYNAWNRLIQVKNSSGTSLMTYGYDATGRRVAESPASGTATDLYYSNDWQVLEEQQGGVTKAQYVWGLASPDELVLRDRDADGSSSTGNLGITGSGLEERLYVQQDAIGNITALVDTSGAVTQHFIYGAYGSVTVLSPSWSSTTDAYSWQYLFQSGRLDLTSALYNFRNRDYSATLQRWVQSDPAGYIDGSNTYRADDSNPTTETDPTGLNPADPHAGATFDTPPPLEQQIPDSVSRLRQQVNDWNSSGYGLAAKMLNHFLDNTGTPLTLTADDIATIRHNIGYETMRNDLFQRIADDPANPVGKAIPFDRMVTWHWVPFLDGELAWAFGAAAFHFKGTLTKSIDCDGERTYTADFGVTETDIYHFSNHSWVDSLFPSFYAGIVLEKAHVAAPFSNTGTWSEHRSGVWHIYAMRRK